MEKAEITITKAVVLFEYGLSNKRYRDRFKLHHQVVNKALFITGNLYLGYSFLFLFDNSISHSVYTKDA